MLLNIVVSLAAWVQNLRPKYWEDPNWGRLTVTAISALVGGLGSAYFVGSTDIVTSAIASYAGSTVFSGFSSVMLSPKPLPPKSIG